MNNMVEKVKAWVNENPRRAMITGAAVVIFIIGFFIDVPAPHVALGGEPISSSLPSWLTNAVLMTIIVDIVLVVLALLATSRMKEIPAGIQNVIYADVDGNIGYQMPGMVPQRRGGDGSKPVPGWVHDYQWEGYLPFEALPYTFNPAQGYVATANQPVLPAAEADRFVSAGYDQCHRAARINDMIQAKDTL